jgi:hypothetical protein
MAYYGVDIMCRMAIKMMNVTHSGCIEHIANRHLSSSAITGTVIIGIPPTILFSPFGLFLSDLNI